MLKQTLVMLTVLSLTASLAFGAVGKLVGKVTDRETGDVLPGANITIVGSQLGAACNVDGEFFILNIAPGNYTVEASFIGYGKVSIQNVRIAADLTEELNFKLVPESIEGNEVVIISERPIFERGATNTIRIMEGEQIDALPIRGATQAVGIQAGVVSQEGSGGVGGNATLNIRGGRGNEALVVVDGVVQNSGYDGFPTGVVSNQAIEQLAVQVGGFEAKYGQAQSGVINITTKSGASQYAFGAEAITSEATDDYGYNLVNFSLSGPLLPGSENHSFFALMERGDFLDGNPSAVSTVIPSAGIDSKVRPENEEDLYRWNAKTNHRFGEFRLRLSTNGQIRNGRLSSLLGDGLERFLLLKNSPEHIARFDDDSYSFSGRLTHSFSANTFWNLTGFQRDIKYERGDGVFFDNVLAYGDTTINRDLVPWGQGTLAGKDSVGVFYDKGYVDPGGYRTYETLSRGLDFDLTSQQGKHLIEFGAGFTRHRYNYYTLSNPQLLAVGLYDDPNTPADERDLNGDGAVNQADTDERYLGQFVFNTHIGFTPDGKRDNASARKPEEGYLFLQDKIEFSDLVLNLGVRLDYFDAKGEKLVSRTNPFGGGTDSQAFDEADFEPTESELDISPRIGLGFPVSENTMFHAQYGKFVQHPRFFELYWSRNRYDRLLSDENFSVNVGDLTSEKTIQYEAGLRKTIGSNVALDVTAFYKDVEGLVNSITTKWTKGSSIKRYYGPTNTDFGTIKGLALKLDIRRTNYVAFSLDYTLSQAEGTGSTQSSSLVAAFRNDDGETPVGIAPLDFDQRHTLSANVDIRIPTDANNLLANAGANFLITYNSGRPYTPLETQNVLSGWTNFGDTDGFVNSRFGPSQFRIDMKIDKVINLSSMQLVPYLWVINLTNRVNTNTVYQSTGDEYSSGFLSTPQGLDLVRSSPYPEQFISDYQAYEQDPAFHGIPRQIRLGLKLNLK